MKRSWLPVHIRRHCSLELFAKSILGKYLWYRVLFFSSKLFILNFLTYKKMYVSERPSDHFFIKFLVEHRLYQINQFLYNVHIFYVKRYFVVKVWKWFFKIVFANALLLFFTFPFHSIVILTTKQLYKRCHLKFL